MLAGDGQPLPLGEKSRTCRLGPGPNDTTGAQVGEKLHFISCPRIPMIQRLEGDEEVSVVLGHANAMQRVRLILKILSNTF